MSKDEILAKYLNTVYMGDSVFGVEAAAQSYFKKEAKQLTLSEAALLAGVLPAPSLYSPRSNPENAERRRNEVLNQIEDTAAGLTRRGGQGPGRHVQELGRGSEARAQDLPAARRRRPLPVLPRLSPASTCWR